MDSKILFIFSATYSKFSMRGNVTLRRQWVYFIGVETDAKRLELGMGKSLWLSVLRWVQHPLKETKGAECKSTQLYAERSTEVDVVLVSSQSHVCFP